MAETKNSIVSFTEKIEDVSPTYNELEHNFEVDFEVQSLVKEFSETDNIFKSINNIEERQHILQERIDALNTDIDRLTNNADGLDYTIAVVSGILCGVIDSFFVGEFDFSELKADSNKFVNKSIEKIAKLNGYKGKKGLEGAIRYIEKKFPVDQDNIYKDKKHKKLGISSDKLHHLEDIAHHPSPLGLVAAILVTFFRVATFVDGEGTWHFLKIDTDKKKLIEIFLPIVISAIIR